MNNLTPYDTGHRAQPFPWTSKRGGKWATGTEYVRDAEDDHFGRVDFDTDGGDTLATVYAERQEGGRYVLDVFAHDSDVIVRESSDDATADIREALRTYSTRMERGVNRAADAEDADDALWADGEMADAARAFAPIAARWIAARLGMGE